MMRVIFSLLTEAYVMLIVTICSIIPHPSYTITELCHSNLNIFLLAHTQDKVIKLINKCC